MLLLIVIVVADDDSTICSWGTVLHSHGAFAFGEMWIGVAIAVVVGMVPVLIQGSVIAVYLFIITVIGGNFNILVTVFVQAGLDRQWALLITFPGLYMLSSILFIVTFFVHRCEIAKAQNSSLYASIVVNSE